ncbi:MAG: right-handed parallel beta-helix repeat-containing protein [Nitrososphaera sp.]
MIDLPPIFGPPDDEPEPEQEPASDDNSTEPAGDGNSTSTPPAAEPPAGNESSVQPRPSIQQSSIPSTNPCLEYDESHTVNILCDADIYELFSGLRDDSITQQLGSGQILIKANITVNEDATFTINSGRGINYVKIAGNNGITVYGSVHIDNISITSWDQANNAVIDQDSTGSVPRAYLFISGSAESHIFNSELGYMGYNETGYRGVDLMTNSSDFHIENSTIHHMWYGFFSNGAYNITIASSVYRDNHQYAVDPHTGTHNMTLSNNTIHDNREGLICSLDCYDIIFEYNQIYNNSGTGIFFSRNTHDSVARFNTIHNQLIGIGFSESSNNEAYGNNIMSVERGIFFNDPEDPDDGSTTNNRVYNNTISDSTVGMAAFRTTGNIAANSIFYNINMSHYRLDANSTLTIENQPFDNAKIETRTGNNSVNFAKCGNIMIDGKAYDASLQHTTTLSDQTIMVNSVQRK